MAESCTRIHWRLIALIGLAWFFIVNGPACAEYLSTRPCHPRIIATCEP